MSQSYKEKILHLKKDKNSRKPIHSALNKLKTIFI